MLWLGWNPVNPIIQVLDKKPGGWRKEGKNKEKGKSSKKMKENQLELFFFLVLCGVSLAPHWEFNWFRETLTENSPVLSSKSLCLRFLIVLYRWFFWRYCPWILTLRDNWGDCNVPRSKEDLPTMSLAKGVVKNSFDHVKVLVKLYNEVKIVKS